MTLRRSAGGCCLLGDDLERAVVVAVPVVRMVQVAVHEVVDVIPVRHGLVPTAGAVDVTRLMPVAGVLGRALGGVRVVDGDPVLVAVVAVGMVQVPLVQVVDVTLVTNRDVSAVLAVLVIVLVDLVTHVDSPLGRPLSLWLARVSARNESRLVWVSLVEVRGKTSAVAKHSRRSATHLYFIDAHCDQRPSGPLANRIVARVAPGYREAVLLLAGQRIVQGLP